jgi:Ca2+/Na+ antiporter
MDEPQYYQSEPFIKERKIWNQNNLFLAVLLGLFFAILDFVTILLLDLDIAKASFLGLGLVAIYTVFLFFLVEPQLLREINRTTYHTVEKPIVKEVEKIIDRKVPVYIQQPRKKLDIPKYNFVGSSETKVYHKKSCRLGKSIKKKYRVNNNSEDFFKKRKYKACKVCLNKKSNKHLNPPKEKTKKKVAKKTTKKTSKKLVR